MNTRARIAALLFTSLIILASQISIPFAFAPSLTNTIVSSGAVVYPRAWANDLVVYPYTITDALAAFIGSHFNLVDFDFGATVGFQKIKAANPSITMIGYYSIYSTATYQPDWSTINANESWFLHDSSNGKRLQDSGGSYMMDFSNAGWRNHVATWCANQLATYPMVDGIFADNAQEAIIFTWGNPFYETSGTNLVSCPIANVSPQAIVTNWNTYMIQLIQAIKSAIGNKLLIINSPDLNGLLVQYCDGQMIEHFLHRIYLAPNDWSTSNPIDEMALLDKLSATGKVVMAFSGATIPQNPTSTDIALTHQCMLYCLSGFLLAYNGKASFGFQMLQYDYTGHNSYWSDMDAPIGAPVSARYNVQGSLWARDFANGKVFLNIDDSATYTVSVGGTVYNVSPRSGLIVSSSGLIAS